MVLGEGPQLRERVRVVREARPGGQRHQAVPPVGAVEGRAQGVPQHRLRAQQGEPLAVLEAAAGGLVPPGGQVDPGLAACALVLVEEEQVRHVRELDADEGRGGQHGVRLQEADPVHLPPGLRGAAERRGGRREDHGAGARVAELARRARGARRAVHREHRLLSLREPRGAEALLHAAPRALTPLVVHPGPEPAHEGGEVEGARGAVGPGRGGVPARRVRVGARVREDEPGAAHGARDAEEVEEARDRVAEARPRAVAHVKDDHPVQLLVPPDGADVRLGDPRALAREAVELGARAPPALRAALGGGPLEHLQVGGVRGVLQEQVPAAGAAGGCAAGGAAGAGGEEAAADRGCEREERQQQTHGQEGSRSSQRHLFSQ